MNSFNAAPSSIGGGTEDSSIDDDVAGVDDEAPPVEKRGRFAGSGEGGFSAAYHVVGGCIE
jgi:hypothetical protein